jgi:hypothetical protein
VLCGFLQIANPGVLPGGVGVVEMKLAVEVARVDRNCHQRKSRERDFDVPGKRWNLRLRFAYVQAIILRARTEPHAELARRRVTLRLIGASDIALQRAADFPASTNDFSRLTSASIFFWAAGVMSGSKSCAIHMA